MENDEARVYLSLARRANQSGFFSPERIRDPFQVIH